MTSQRNFNWCAHPATHYCCNEQFWDVIVKRLLENVATIVHMGASVRSQIVQWWRRSRNTLNLFFSCWFFFFSGLTSRKITCSFSLTCFAVGITGKFSWTHKNTGHHIFNFPVRGWNTSGLVFSIELAPVEFPTAPWRSSITQIKLDS